MKYIYIPSTVIVLSLFSMLFCQPVLAEDPRYLSSYQSEYGLKLYNDGKIDFAIERFTKALLLDPQNKAAKDALRKISEEMSSPTSSHALKISRFIDQIEYFDFLDLRYRSLTEENGRLFQFIRNNVSKDATLSEKIETIQSRQVDRPVSSPSVGIVGFANDDNKSSDLDGIIASLASERQRLLKEINFWEGQNNDLRSLRRTILSQGSAETPTVVANKYKTQLEEIQSRVSDKDSLLSSQNQNIEYFKTELSSVRESFNTLQEKFKNTDTKIADLTKKLAEMSLEAFEKNKIIAEKDSYAASLQKEISEANEKMSLVQRIIQEKDDRIASLEKEMAQVNVAVNSNAATSDPQVAQLKADLKAFEGQFKSQMEKSRDRIVGLEIQFADLTQKYQDLVSDVQEKDTQISLLKGNVQKKQIALDQYREAFMTTNMKANELIGMVDIYRSKLAETKQSLIVKEEELHRLQTPATKIEQPVQAEHIESNSNPNYHSELDLTFSQKVRPITAVEGR